MAVDGDVLQLVDVAPVCGEGIAVTEEGAHPEKGIGAALGNGVEAAAPVYEGTLVPSLVGPELVPSGLGRGCHILALPLRWPSWKRRTRGFSSWDACPDCWELGPGPQACAGPGGHQVWR